MEGSAAQAAAEKTAGKIASAGQPEAGEFKIPTPAQQNPDEDGKKGDSGATGEDVRKPEGEGAKGDEGKPADPAAPQLPDLSDDQLKALLEKRGVTGFTDLNNLGEVVKKATAPAPAEPTAEEKKAAEDAMEKRMLDFYVNAGGKVEDFVNIKTVLATDLKELSAAELKRELKAEGFDDNEIAEVLKERYYQIELDKLEKGEDESDEDFNKRKAILEKKVAYGNKKLGTRSSHIQTQARNIYEGLKKAVKQQDAHVNDEAVFAQSVDTHAKSIPREMTFELGEVENEKLPPVKINVTDDDIAEVTTLLKDPGKRNQLFYNQDGTFNIPKVTEVLLRNRILEAALKEAHKDGGTRQVEIFEKKFGGKGPGDLGVGGAQRSGTGRKGHIVGAGAPEPASFPNN